MRLCTGECCQIRRWNQCQVSPGHACISAGFWPHPLPAQPFAQRASFPSAPMETTRERYRRFLLSSRCHGWPLLSSNSCQSLASHFPEPQASSQPGKSPVLTRRVVESQGHCSSVSPSPQHSCYFHHIRTHFTSEKFKPTEKLKE